MLTPLITFISDMPLKGKIGLHIIVLALYKIGMTEMIFLRTPDRTIPPGILPGLDYCLSPAPQAVPQAAGFSSGLSPAPQAVPQAAGFSSGLSPAPQAEPAISLFHAKRLESAISSTSTLDFSGYVSLCTYYFTEIFFIHKYAHFYDLVTFL